MAAAGAPPSGVSLVAAEASDFDWMLGEAESGKALRLPPGGVDAPEVISIVRRMARRFGPADGTGCWMIVAGGEVVGLISYKRPPDGLGQAEIGYGVAESRRRLGHASAAVAALADLSAASDKIRTLVAETARDNIASQRALERNGFTQTGERVDAEDGPLILWRRDLQPARA